MTDIRIIKALAKGHQDILNTKIREFFKTQGKEVNDLPYDILPPLNSPGNPSQQFLDELMGFAVEALEREGFRIVPI
jgi:hypothetical protein